MVMKQTISTNQAIFFFLKRKKEQHSQGRRKGTRRAVSERAWRSAQSGQHRAARTMGADLDSWIAKVRACEYLPENDLKQLCQMVMCPCIACGR